MFGRSNSRVTQESLACQEVELIPVSDAFAKAIASIYSKSSKKRSSCESSTQVAKTVGGWTWSADGRD